MRLEPGFTGKITGFSPVRVLGVGRKDFYNREKIYFLLIF